MARCYSNWNTIRETISPSKDCQFYPTISRRSFDKDAAFSDPRSSLRSFPETRRVSRSYRGFAFPWNDARKCASAVFLSLERLPLRFFQGDDNFVHPSLIKKKRREQSVQRSQIRWNCRGLPTTIRRIESTNRESRDSKDGDGEFQSNFLESKWNNKQSILLYRTNTFIYTQNFVSCVFTRELGDRCFHFWTRHSKVSVVEQRHRHIQNTLFAFPLLHTFFLYILYSIIKPIIPR